MNLFQLRAGQLDKIVVFFVVGLDARGGLLGRHVPRLEWLEPRLHVGTRLRVLDFRDVVKRSGAKVDQGLGLILVRADRVME